MPTSLSVASDDIHVYLKDASIFIDSTAGAIGGTQILDALHSFTLRGTQELDLKRFANGAQQFEINGYGRGARIHRAVVRVRQDRRHGGHRLRVRCLDERRRGQPLRPALLRVHRLRPDRRLARRPVLAGWWTCRCATTPAPMARSGATPPSSCWAAPSTTRTLTNPFESTIVNTLDRGGVLVVSFDVHDPVSVSGYPAPGRGYGQPPREARPGRRDRRPADDHRRQPEPARHGRADREAGRGLSAARRRVWTLVDEDGRPVPGQRGHHPRTGCSTTSRWPRRSPTPRTSCTWPRSSSL